MKHYLLLVVVVVAVLSCNEPNYSGPDIPGKKLTVKAGIQQFQSRASGAQWDNEDVIGVSVEGMIDYSIDTNIPFIYTLSTAAFSPISTEIYLKGESQTISAYYPYAGAQNEAPKSKAISTVAENQTSQGQKSIDYLYAKTTATRNLPQAHFQFQHVMSMFHLIFVAFDSSTDKVDFTLSGFVHTGSFDPTTGIATPKIGANASDIALTTANMNSTLLLLPQKVNLKISLFYKNKSYTGTFADLELVAGCRHEYVVKINSESQDPSLTIESNGITQWQPGAGGNIETEENAVEAEPSTGDSAWGKGDGGDIESEDVQ